MKKALIVSLGILLAAAALGAADFGYPVDGEPWYHIKARFDNTASLGAGVWSVTAVTVNGQRARDFILAQKGKDTTSPEVDGTSPFDLKVRWSWQAGQSYEIAVQLQNAKLKTSAALTAKAKAPAGKGYWDRGWKNQSGPSRCWRRNR